MDYMTDTIIYNRAVLFKKNIQPPVGCRYNKVQYNIDSLVQDCSISIANALEILQSCSLALSHWHDIAYSTTVAEAEHKSMIELTKNIP